MKADIRKHEALRGQVRDGLAVLRTQVRQVWRDREGWRPVPHLRRAAGNIAQIIRDTALVQQAPEAAAILRMGEPSPRQEFERELGELILSSVRWIDELGYDPMQCLDRAIGAQERFTENERDDGPTRRLTRGRYEAPS